MSNVIESGQEFFKRTATITESVPSGSQLGVDVDVSGDWAAVGNLGPTSNMEGQVFIYRRVSGVWAQTQRIQPSVSPFQLYGVAVAIDGATLVIGSMTGESVFVYELSGTTWTQVAILTASDNTPGDSFGSAVALSGDVIVVGTTNNNKGYVYEKGAGWTNKTEDQQIVGADTLPGDQFAKAVGTDGTTIVAGAQGYGWVHGGVASAAYTFQKVGGTWTQQAILRPSDGDPSDDFGLTCDVDGDHVFVGATQSVIFPLVSGKAYLFAVDGTENQIIIPSDGADGDHFAKAIRIQGDRAVISSSNHNSIKGAAYVYRKISSTQWEQIWKIEADDATVNDTLPYVGISHDTDTRIIAGAAGWQGGASLGRALIYESLFVKDITVSE